MSKLASYSLAAAVLFSASPAFCQKFNFDAASIKPAADINPMALMSGEARMGMKVDGAMVDIRALTLTSLICTAYNVKAYQVTGPDWMSSQRFDIIAAIPAGAGKDHVNEMLQALLADRFKMTIHRGPKETQIYALVAGKNGAKLTPAAPDDPAAPASGPSAQDDASMHISGDPQHGMTVSNLFGSSTFRMTMANGAMHMDAPKMTMAQFAEALSRFLDRPVIDMTGIKGNYQVAFDVSMEEMMNAAKSVGIDHGPMGGRGEGGRGEGGRGGDGPSDPGSSSIFANIQQLGLKLEARKTQSDSIVVEHIEKQPTDN